MNLTKTQLCVLIVIVLVTCCATYFVTHEIYKPQETFETASNPDTIKKAEAAAVSARRTANSTRETAIAAEQASHDADRSARDAANVSILRSGGVSESNKSETK